MVECPYFEHLLVIPRLRVQNANAISSPLTHGFPAVTAFLGLMWALERRTHADGLDLQFNAVGVVVHQHDEQTTKGGFVNTFRLTRNPVDRVGKSAAIVEEGRMHLEISLVFAVESQALQDLTLDREIIDRVAHILSGMRVAGGTVIPSDVSRHRNQPFLVPFTGDKESQRTLFNKLKLRLLPGFILVERQDVLEQRYQALIARNPEVTRLDAWLSLARINWSWDHSSQNADAREWRHDRSGLGWIVPIPLGYGALTEVQAAGTVTNTRDKTTSFCFVESLYGIGQWLSPHRLHSPQQMLWYPDSKPEKGLYRCRNDYWSVSADELEYYFD